MGQGVMEGSNMPWAHGPVNLRASARLDARCLGGLTSTRLDARGLGGMLADVHVETSAGVWFFELPPNPPVSGGCRSSSSGGGCGL